MRVAPLGQDGPFSILKFVQPKNQLTPSSCRHQQYWHYQFAWAVFEVQFTKLHIYGPQKHWREVYVFSP
jgi:hypothetical protein